MTARFDYVAYDEAGAKRQGQVDAVSPESARSKLKEQGLVPIKISRVDNAARKSGGNPFF